MLKTALLVLGFGSSVAFGQQVYIQSLNFAGSGCSPQDSSGALYDTNQDGLADQFEVLFSNYVAEQGPGVPFSARRRNCNISLQLHLPQGFQFSIANVRYLGYGDIPAGVRGRQRSSYEFPFFSNTVTSQTVLNGAFTGNYQRQDDLGIASIVWSPCGTSAPLNIRTQVSLEGNSGLRAALTTDQIDGRVKQIYGFQWRACR